MKKQRLSIISLSLILVSTASFGAHFDRKKQGVSSPSVDNNLPLQEPDNEGKVVVTFPSPEFLAKTQTRGIQIIGLGQHETFLSNIATHKLTRVPMSLANEQGYGQAFSLEKDGFEATRFDIRLMKRIASIYDKTLEEPTQENINRISEKLRKFVPCMESFVSRYYSQKYTIPESELLVKCSKNPFPRIAGLSAEKQGKIIAANPLMHIDYFSEDRAYSTQSGRDGTWHLENNISIDDDFFPSQSHLYDALNLWIPLETVEDFELGFIPNSDYDYRKIIEVELFNGSRAATIPFSDSMKRIVHKPRMSPGEVYIFRSTSIRNDPNKKGVLHGTFRSGNKQNVLRRSAETRCLVFRNKGFELNPNYEYFNDGEKTISETFSMASNQLENNKSRFQNLVMDSKINRSFKTIEALTALQGSWTREWQHPLSWTTNGLLSQGVREIDNPSDRKILSSKEYLPISSESFDSDFYANAKNPDSLLGRLTIKDIQDNCNKFGVIELFNGFISDLNGFEYSYASPALATVREQPIVKIDLKDQSHSKKSTIQNTLRGALREDIERMFQNLNAPVKIGRQYYFTVELFGAGAPPNFFFWHKDRTVLLERNKTFESEDRKRVPFAYQGFLYYTGLPTWFLIGGEARNGIEFFELENATTSSKHNTALGLWFAGSPFHSVPTPVENKAMNAAFQRRFFLRFRVFEVSNNFFVPTKEEAREMNQRFEKWQKGDRVGAKDLKSAKL